MPRYLPATSPLLQRFEEHVASRFSLAPERAALAARTILRVKPSAYYRWRRSQDNAPDVVVALIEVCITMLKTSQLRTLLDEGTRALTRTDGAES